MHAYLLTCPGREALCAATLAELARSDWGENVTVIVDGGDGCGTGILPVGGPSIAGGSPADFDRRDAHRTGPTHRQDACATAANPIARGHAGLLHTALQRETGPFLALEDDLLIHPRLRWHLERWAPLAEGRLHFGTLYNPGLRLLPDGTADTLCYLGGQARLFSPTCARHHLAALRGPGLRQDMRLARAAAQLGPLHVHQPSLVQHIGRESTWSGPWHQAWDWSGTNHGLITP